MIGQKGVPIQINFKNLLSGAAASQHIIPVDTTIPGANQAPNRTAVHLHGGLVPWISDGGPFDWWNFAGLHGLELPEQPGPESERPRLELRRVLLPHEPERPVPLVSRPCPRHHPAQCLCRHCLRPAAPRHVRANLRNEGLPNFIEAGGNELPLVIQEKVFVGPGHRHRDPTWFDINLQKVTKNPGSLLVRPPRSRPLGRREGGLTLPNPSSIPEFFGDTMLVNGTTYPQVTVQARRYRLRLLNATNARFLNLQLYVADGSAERHHPGFRRLPDQHGVQRTTPLETSRTGCRSAPRAASWREPALVPSNVPLTFQVLPDEETGRPTRRRSTSPWSWRRRSGPTSSSTSRGTWGRASSSTLTHLPRSPAAAPRPTSSRAWTTATRSTRLTPQRLRTQQPRHHAVQRGRDDWRRPTRR